MDEGVMFVWPFRWWHRQREGATLAEQMRRAHADQRRLDDALAHVTRELAILRIDARDFREAR